MKRANIDKVQAGDIILTARKTLQSKGIRATTWGDVSHAMICVQHGSIIDSTSDGVHSRNLQREIFEDDEKIFAFRLRDKLDQLQLAQVIDYAREQVGAPYSKLEAVRSVAGVRKPRSKKQFCSRLVARAYASIGVQLVDDEDYCTPEQLRNSPLLLELTDIEETVSQAEVSALRNRPDQTQVMRDAQNIILEVARRFDPEIVNFSDIYALVQKHPEWDGAIAGVLQSSGYLNLWENDRRINPAHYDLRLMEILGNSEKTAEVRSHCVAIIKEFYSGGRRFATMLTHYKRLNTRDKRETFSRLIILYETLVREYQLRANTALEWLRRHSLEDVRLHLEQVPPHSELWFSIVDVVEPKLGLIARQAIAHEGSKEICSSCGDVPAQDYRIANAAEAMPGVPSLRLCDDCLGIRRGFGEILEPFYEK